MKIPFSRRAVLKASVLGLAAIGCRNGLAKAIFLGDAAKPILAATAEALVPVEGLVGEQASWAMPFLMRRFKEKPEEIPAWNALAKRLETQARHRHGKGMDELPATEREAIVRDKHPTLVDDPGLSVQRREDRRLLRSLTQAFFLSDHLTQSEAAALIDANLPRRDVRQPSTPEFSKAGALPDLQSNRFGAMDFGTGDYQRAWIAGGYAGALPGLCKTFEDYVDKPRLPAV